MWEKMGEGRWPPVGLSVRWGRAGARVLRSKGLGPRAQLPHQTPGSWGSGAKFWGVGIHAEECPPSNGLDPVRKEINKKGWEGDQAGVKGLGNSVQTKGLGDGGRASPGQARARIRVSLGLGPRCRGLRGPR